ncbi:hypothetical protein BT69DRAFT_1286917, partial [Atractiella rhizophila]
LPSNPSEIDKAARQEYFKTKQESRVDKKMGNKSDTSLLLVLVIALVRVYSRSFAILPRLSPFLTNT